MDLRAKQLNQALAPLILKRPEIANLPLILKLLKNDKLF